MRWLLAMIVGAALGPMPAGADSAPAAPRALPWPPAPQEFRADAVQPAQYLAPAGAPADEAAAREPAAAAASPAAGGTARGPGLPLPPPGHHRGASSGASGEPAPSAAPAARSATSLTTMAASLILVLGLFLLVAWVLRRAAPGQAMVLPKEVLEILGRAPLAGRTQLQLLRCGKKLVLVSVVPGGVESLAEITDPAEVDRLCGLCQAARPDSATAVFHQVLQRMSRDDRRPGPQAAEAEHAY